MLAKAAKTFGYQDYFTSDFTLPIKRENFPRFLNHRQAINASGNTVSSAENNTIGIGSLHLHPVTASDLQDWLEIVPENNYIQGHIPENTVFNQLLQTLNYRHLIIIRDPRAVIASLVPFVNNAKNTLFKAHFLGDDFLKMSLEERFDFILTGGYAEQAQLQVKSFKAVYQSFYQWRDHSNCLLLKFEDLIGEQGGGEQEAQYNAITKIAQHLEIEFDDVK
ncbi:MAG: sulfotransferase domain-containing protein, partial [Methylococcales bacterium]|nr:sulfotransferase domain-containing protein [Methylococcales bacterium]